MTLDPEVVELIKKEVHARRSTFKAVVNQAIRRGLAGPHGEPLARYHLKSHHARLRPGYDRSSLNRLADELEDEAILAAQAGRRTTRSPASET